MFATPLLFAAAALAAPAVDGPPAGPSPFAYAGRAVTPGGEPAAGAVVRIARNDFSTGEYRRVSAEAVAGDDGRFLLEDLPTEALATEVLLPNYHAGVVAAPAGWGEEGYAGDLAPGLRPAPAPLAGRVCDVGDVPLTRGTVYSGRCLDAAGEPVAGAEVAFTLMAPGAAKEVTDAATVTAGGDGAFATPPLPPWVFWVTATADGRQPAQRQLPGADGSRAAVTLRPLVLEKASPAVLEVVDAAGDPVPGFTLQVDGPRTKTGPDGRLPLPGLSESDPVFLMPRDTRYRIVDDVEVKQTGALPDGTRLFRYVAEPARDLVFAVTDAVTGDPVRVKACVVCVWQEKEGKRRLVGCMNPRVRRLEGGRVAVAHQGAHPYHLAIAAEGYETSDIYLPELEEDATAVVGPFELTPNGEPTEPVSGDPADPDAEAEEPSRNVLAALLASISTSATLEGRVEPTGGADPAGATVTLWGPPFDRWNDPVNTRSVLGRLVPFPSNCLQATTTDADGRFEFALPRPGKYQVRVDCPPADVEGVVQLEDRPAPAKRWIEVEGGETLEVTFAPAFPGTIAGRPWAYAGVRGAAAGPGWAVAFDGENLLATAPVDANGRFRITGLPPGEYGVKVGSPGRGDREVWHDWAPFGHLLPEDPGLDVMTAVDWEESGLKPDPWRRAAKVTVEPGAVAEVVAGLSD